MKKITMILILAFVALALAGCSADRPLLQGATANGTLDYSEAGENMSFGITIENDGDPLGIYFETKLNEGSIRLQLVDSNGSVVWSQSSGMGTNTIHETLTDLNAGDYRLGWAWDGVLKGSYSFAWQPGGMALPPITAWAFVPGVGMLLVSLGFIFYALKKKLGWRYLLLGALAWIATVSLKFAFATLVNQSLYTALLNTLAESIASPIFYVYVGLLTGIFEVALTYLALRFARLGMVEWKKALSFGIGFGSVEALLLAVSPLALAVTLFVSPESLPVSTRLNLGYLNDPLYVISPVWERFFTIWIHVFCNVLIFLAVVKKKPGWFWLSFAFKSLLDVAAAYGQLTGLETIGKIWAIEGYVGLMGLIAWWGVTRVKKMYPEEVKAPPTTD